MKILLTVHQFFPKWTSGTEVLTLETAKDLIARGHEVRIIAADPVDCEAASNNSIYNDEYCGIPIYRVNHNFNIYPNIVRCEYLNERMAEITKTIIDEFKPDIVHIMHCSRLSASIIDIFKQADIPVVITVTDFWFICPFVQLRLPDNLPCKGPNICSTNCLKCYVSKSQPQETIGKISKIPTAILTLINGIAKFPFVERWEKGALIRALVRRKQYSVKQINKLDKIIAPTEIMIKLLSANGVRKEKVVKLAFGLNTEYLKKEYRVKRNKGTIKFGYIGTLVEYKGTHILLKAFKELEKTCDNIELKIYGDLSHFPNYVEELKSIRNSDEKIKFLGTFPNSEIGTILEEIDVLVVPSIWYENTPLVIYSAFGTKTPVIATNLEGMTEVVHHNVNGLTFEKENIEDLKEQMKRIVEEKDLLGKLSSGIKEVKSIGKNVDEIESIYKEILNNK